MTDYTNQHKFLLTASIKIIVVGLNLILLFLIRILKNIIFKLIK